MSSSWLPYSIWRMMTGLAFVCALVRHGPHTTAGLITTTSNLPSFLPVSIISFSASYLAYPYGSPFSIRDHVFSSFSVNVYVAGRSYCIRVNVRVTA